ncbi:MAG: transcription termination/antitermination factor NusG [Clostridia bacterium]|nr:transcription termination/antitermination factor NusG [Clostridia bacterium]
MYDEYRWYVVHTYSGYENKVASNLIKVIENRGLQDMLPEVCIPTETVVEVKDDQRKEVERKLFPGYVLVKTAVFYDDKVKENKMTDEIWYIIRNTRGVTGFVGPESKPIPLTEAEVLKLGVEKRTVEVSYQVGDLVTIIGGSFDGFSGVVDNIDIESETVRVIISMMGRDTPLELGLDQVEPALD